MRNGTVSTFLRYRYLLQNLVTRDLKVKYRRSVLGILWSLLNPILMMLVMSAVFSTIFKNTIEFFSLYLICGQTLFGFFNEAGELLEKWTIPTRVSDEHGKVILSDIAASVLEHKKTVDGEIIGICIDVPGPVTNAGTVLTCVNLYWKNVDFCIILCYN